MTNITKILAVALTMVAGSIAISGTSLAGSWSYYPDHLKNPSVPAPSIGGGSRHSGPNRLAG